MIGTTARPDFQPEIPPAPLATHRPGPSAPLITRPAFLVGIAAVTLVVGVILAFVGVAVLVGASPPSAAFSVTDGAQDVPLSADIRVALTGWNSDLVNAALYQAPLEADGRAGPEQPLAVQATVLRTGEQAEGMELSLRPVTGQLEADARYRLVVEASGLVPGAILPSSTTYEREIRFTTLRSPVPRAQAAPAKLKWGQPLQIQWNAPVDSVGYTVDPPTPVRTQIDAANRQISAIYLEDPADGQTYTVTVAEARGVNGIPMKQAAQYTVTAPQRPALQEAEEKRTVEIGQPVTLRWNVPVDRLKLATEPALKTNWQVDRRDPQTVQVSLEGLEQGQTYKLTVAEAFTKEGTPLAEPASLELETPGKLMVQDWDTGSEPGTRVSAQAKPAIIFEQPIRDRKAALAAISMEPKVPGKWEWVDDTRVEFKPTKTLPFDAEVTIKIKPGPDGARSVAGSFFEREAILSFVTEVDKLIDVDISTQTMTLYEKGKVVNTFPVATGVPGADTPIGEFNVQYKMPKARFQGTNVTGAQYDIPDVNWVLAFMGDYTIHGSYWRNGFGAPASNGCVSLSDENAKKVFDWAPDGTRIHIHE
ncbi:MAG: L,D-transpeptidase family protein [Chloroflexota bacterium]